MSPSRPGPVEDVDRARTRRAGPASTLGCRCPSRTAPRAHQFLSTELCCLSTSQIRGGPRPAPNWGVVLGQPGHVQMPYIPPGTTFGRTLPCRRRPPSREGGTVTALMLLLRSGRRVSRRHSVGFYLIYISTPNKVNTKVRRAIWTVVRNDGRCSGTRSVTLSPPRSYSLRGHRRAQPMPASRRRPAATGRSLRHILTGATSRRARLPAVAPPRSRARGRPVAGGLRHGARAVRPRFRTRAQAWRGVLLAMAGVA